MEVLGKFGINPILLVAQTVNFLIILFIVKKFALKPILQMLKNREKTIKEGLQQAEEAKKLLEETGKKEREVLKKAQLEARALLDDTKKQQEEFAAKAEAKTHAQVEKMLEEARQVIQQDTKDAEKRLSAHISELAVELLQKSASELFTEAEQKTVMTKAIKNLKKEVN